jgi:hypothetical protein
MAVAGSLRDILTGVPKQVQGLIIMVIYGEVSGDTYNVSVMTVPQRSVADTLMVPGLVPVVTLISVELELPVQPFGNVQE